MSKERILEQHQRLAESTLWTLQRDAYTQFGVDAWSHQGVPFYLTSSPYIARQYAQVTLGFLRDGLEEKVIDDSQPIYIIDLGAGSGRFGYLFLKELLQYLQKLSLTHLSIRYIMTDIAENNIAFWQKHSKLQPFIESGVLDFAYYAHHQQTPLELIKSKEILMSSHLVNPMILIANYFFDTIPQDLFRVIDGKLYEGQITLSATMEENQTGPSIINHLKAQYTYKPIETENYYACTRWNEILHFYKQSLEESCFLLPTGAFQTLDFFAKLSKHALLVLAGDQGVASLKQIEQMGEPKIALHGTFSISVNYHALSLYFQKHRGVGWLCSFSTPIFAMLVGLLGDPESFSETALAFQQHINAFDPSEYMRLVTMIENHARLEDLLILIQLGNWDPVNCNLFLTQFLQLLPNAREEEKRKLAIILDKAWENFYPISQEESHFALNLGVLFYKMGNQERALFYFYEALQLDPNNSLALKNIAACKTH